MTSITMTALAAALLFYYVESKRYDDRLSRIQTQLDDLRATVDRIAERDYTVQIDKPETEKALPPPIRDPNADVTGASARTVERTARQSSCKSNCEQVIKCLASSPACPGWRTDSDVPAMKACLASCRRQDAVKRELASLTDCGGVTRFTNHSIFQDLCQ